MKKLLAVPKAVSMSSLRRMTIGVAAIMAAAVLTASYAGAQVSCQGLWVERNSYYKEAGYCFKTARAISYFGNAGCLYDNEARLPLSGFARARIAEITRLEQRLGCN
jgi:hypothetical protein